MEREKLKLLYILLDDFYYKYDHEEKELEEIDNLQNYLWKDYLKISNKWRIKK